MKHGPSATMLMIRAGAGPTKPDAGTALDHLNDNSRRTLPS